jgi:hypothetical protein
MEEVVGEFSTILNLKSSEEFNDEINFIIQNIEPGIFKLSVEGEKVLIEESFIYGGRSITGFVLSDIINDYSYVGVIFFIFSFLTILVVRRIFQLRRKKLRLVYKHHVN